MTKLLHFCAEEVTRWLPPFSVHYEAIKDTMIDYSVKKSVVQPVRQQLTIPNTADRYKTGKCECRNLEDQSAHYTIFLFIHWFRPWWLILQVQKFMKSDFIIPRNQNITLTLASLLKQYHWNSSALMQLDEPDLCPILGIDVKYAKNGSKTRRIWEFEKIHEVRPYLVESKNAFDGKFSPNTCVFELLIYVVTKYGSLFAEKVATLRMFRTLIKIRRATHKKFRARFTLFAILEHQVAQHFTFAF